MNSDAWTAQLLARSPGLARADHGPQIARIAGAALAAVDPRACVLRCTHRLRKPRGEAAVVGEFVFDLADDPDAPGPAEHGRIWIFGAGKASAQMSAALVERFGDRVAGGVVIVKHTGQPGQPDAPTLGPVELVVGDHPVPGPRTAAATARLRAQAAQVRPRDLVLCPISGGASALMSEPLLPPEDWAALTHHLLGNDVSIQAINRVRRRFDSLKAGGLARLLSPATVVGLIVSDVVGDELGLVGSGPTVYAEDRDDADHAALLDELGPRLDGLAPALRERLASPPPSPAWPRTPSGRPQSVQQVLVARNGDAREAACQRAHAEGLASLVLLPALGGLAADEGRRLAAVLTSPPADLPLTPPWCVVTGGETTVSLTRDHLADHLADHRPTGVGGRNQELALAAIRALAGRDDLALLSLATDGEDGPTDAAGAMVDGGSFARAQAAGIDLDAALRTHDSHAVFDALGDLIRTGPTGTNVCDLALLFRFS